MSKSNANNPPASGTNPPDIARDDLLLEMFLRKDLADLGKISRDELGDPLTDNALTDDEYEALVNVCRSAELIAEATSPADPVLPADPQAELPTISESSETIGETAFQVQRSEQDPPTMTCSFEKFKKLLGRKMLLHEIHSQFCELVVTTTDSRLNLAFDPQLVHPLLERFAETGMMNTDSLTGDLRIHLAGIHQKCRCVVLAQMSDR